LLTLSEVAAASAAQKAVVDSIDPAAYEAQVKATRLSVAVAFDSYRELKNDLERVHVFSSDNPADSSAARQNGFKVIVIDAPFPPTLAKSSVGIALTEMEQFQR
jgi:hypothetical protein